MELGLGASLLNPVDFFAGWAAGKLVSSGGKLVIAAVDDLAGAIGSKAPVEIDLVASAAKREIATVAGGAETASTTVLSEAAQRARLVERMQGHVREMTQVVDDAILRGDRVVLGEFLYPRELESLLQGGALSAARRGVAIEWGTRLRFALDPLVQQHVGAGGYMGLRYVVGRGVRRGFADFFGTQGGLLSGTAIDITTHGALARHLARGYLEKGLILTY
jgi:hypothetical protein